MRKVKDVLHFYLLQWPFRVTVASFSHILLPFEEVALQMHKCLRKKRKLKGKSRNLAKMEKRIRTEMKF